ncbi:MAG: transcriptional regulator [Hyphococcus sp.]|nr:MAG: transcriptional regulator [Marinicaulis sp.]
METLELFFRFASVTLLLVQIGLIIRDAWDVRAARFGALLSIALIDVVGADTHNSSAIPVAMEYVLSALSMNTAVFIWWFSLSLFDDDFRLGRFDWAVAFVWFALGVFNYNDFVLKQEISYPWAAYARSVMAVAIVGHIIYRALAGRLNDLVEERRRVRVLFAFSIAALFLLDLSSELTFGFHVEPLWFSTIEHGLFLAVIVWSVFWLTRFDKHVLMFERVPSSPAETVQPALSPKEQLLHQKLVGVIEGEKAYLEPELSISTLAERIGAPEHQVRALINKAMGHRNFRSYLNSYRMIDAKAALADPAKADQQILTIAMDAGFASLSSFNRAFKETSGQTPSAFRQAAFNGKPSPQN